MLQRKNSSPTCFHPRCLQSSLGPGLRSFKGHSNDKIGLGFTLGVKLWVLFCFCFLIYSWA